MRSVLMVWLSAASILLAGDLSGRRAPGFSLMDSKFDQHDLQDYRGKIVIVEFMQTACPECAAFAEVLQGVQQRYAGKLVVLAIANPPDNQTTVARYTAGHKLTYPVLFDCSQVAASYLKISPLHAVPFDVPHVFLIDRQGFIRSDYGYSLLTRDIFEGQGLYREVDRLLAAPPAKK